MPHATDVSEKKMSQEEFIAVHGAQLSSSVVPEILWPTLHEKLANEVFHIFSFSWFSIFHT